MCILRCVTWMFQAKKYIHVGKLFMSVTTSVNVQRKVCHDGEKCEEWWKGRAGGSRFYSNAWNGQQNTVETQYSFTKLGCTPTAMNGSTVAEVDQVCVWKDSFGYVHTLWIACLYKQSVTTFTTFSELWHMQTSSNFFHTGFGKFLNKTAQASLLLGWHVRVGAAITAPTRTSKKLTRNPKYDHTTSLCLQTPCTKAGPSPLASSTCFFLQRKNLVFYAGITVRVAKQLCSKYWETHSPCFSITTKRERQDNVWQLSRGNSSSTLRPGCSWCPAVQQTLHRD